MKVAGIDYSTHAVDIVTIDTDTGRLDWHRYKLGNTGDAFDRTRTIRQVMPARTSSLWDDILAIAIEDPRGHNAGALYRAQGAILSCVPPSLLIHPYTPSRWRHLAGIPGNATKPQIRHRSLQLGAPEWEPQDAHDAHLLATAMLADLHAQQAA